MDFVIVCKSRNPLFRDRPPHILPLLGKERAHQTLVPAIHNTRGDPTNTRVSKGP